MWAFVMQSDWDYITSVADLFKRNGAKIFWIELVADQNIRIERNKTENRLANKKSKRDIKASEQRLLNEDKHRLVSIDKEVPFNNYIKIDNTHPVPNDVVDIILENSNSKFLMLMIL